MVFYPPLILKQGVFLHSKTVSESEFLLSHNLVLQAASPQIASDEAKLPRPFKTTLSQLRSSFSSSLHSYCGRIGLILGPLCPFCGMEPYTNIRVFFLFLASDTPDRDGPVWPSTPGVAVSVRPPLLWSPATSSSYPWATSFWSTREIGVIIIINSLVNSYMVTRTTTFSSSIFPLAVSILSARIPLDSLCCFKFFLGVGQDQ